MNVEDQIIAVANHIGLFRIAPLKRTTRKGKEDPKGVVLWYCSEHHGGAATWDKIPDYSASRDAIIKVVSCITPTMRDNFKNWLCRVVERERRMATVDWLCITATASQFLEAYLRTFKLWEEP